MCELLICAVNKTHPDATKDERGCYKRGDVVMVKDDGYQWSANEGLPLFVIVKIPGRTVAQAEKYCLPYTLDDLGGVSPTRIVRRRLHGVEVDAASLPAWVKTSLRDTGTVTVTFTQIRNYIKNKITGATE